MSQSRWTRIIGLVLIVGVLTLSVGCFGGFAAWHKVHDFNKNISDNKAVQEIAFLVLTGVYVYSVAGLLDMLLFNSIEFWTGDNPMGNDFDTSTGGGGSSDG